MVVCNRVVVSGQTIQDKMYFLTDPTRYLFLTDHTRYLFLTVPTRYLFLTDPTRYLFFFNSNLKYVLNQKLVIVKDVSGAVFSSKF